VEATAAGSVTADNYDGMGRVGNEMVRAADGMLVSQESLVYDMDLSLFDTIILRNRNSLQGAKGNQGRLTGPHVSPAFPIDTPNGLQPVMPPSGTQK
jgi:hypothetical protein